MPFVYKPRAGVDWDAAVDSSGLAWDPFDDYAEGADELVTVESVLATARRERAIDCE